VYSDVADAAKDILSRILTADPETLTAKEQTLLTLAQYYDIGARWLASGLIARKAAKRPTMTVAYGSRVFGFKQQIALWLAKDVDKDVIREHFTIMAEDGKQKKLIGLAAKLLAELLMAAMQDAISGPMRAMDWMQDCARIVTKRGHHVEWVVPVTGWRVRQAYYNMKPRRVKTVLAGETVMPVLQDMTDKLDTMKQRNGIAPNIVHSLDAACLMLAVQMARAEGIEAFGLIHDSYACHAANMPVLARAARQAFVRLYAQPVLENLREQFAEQSDGEPLPEVPASGSLDLSGVLASDFFFA
jgi:DNA-directed RNA polymerase